MGAEERLGNVVRRAAMHHFFAKSDYKFHGVGN
jgi:hypothetical protein